MTSPAAESTRTVGPYRLIGQIGEGGMGVVYLAQAPDNRRVAVKILRPSLVGDANGRARLAREVTSLRRVRSSRIAEVYDADPWGETPYVVTRYVAGPSLREVVDQRGPLRGDDLLRLARGLAQALVVVHQADVLHRDVKPSNVLLEVGEPVLIDFGLAQLSDDMTLTQAGWLLGTPGYLAPEILYGEGPTPAADIHAWAATVTFAATGRGPYGRGPAMAIMDRARRGESDLAGVPPDLVDVLSAALRPDPTNRPTARQLVEWLDARLSRASHLTVMAPLPRPAHQVERVDLVEPTGVLGAASAPYLPAVEPVQGAATSGRLRRVALWVAVLLVVVAGVVAAPVVALVWVGCVAWVLRTLSLAALTRGSWREARGPRRRDGVLSALLVPWFGLRALVPSLVGSLLAGFPVGVLMTLARFGPQVLETPALVVAGLMLGLATWFGPAGFEVRRGGRIVTDALPRSALAMSIMLVLLLGVASGLLAAHQIAGTSYAPFSG